MARNANCSPPGKVDIAAEERAIRRATMLATVANLIAFTAGFWLGPLLADLPTGLSERLAFAAVCCAVLGFALLIAILRVSMTRRFSPEDIGGSAAGPRSDKLAIKAAFLQNTLEQTVVAVGFYFALAAVAGVEWLGCFRWRLRCSS